MLTDDLWPMELATGKAGEKLLLQKQRKTQKCEGKKHKNNKKPNEFKKFELLLFICFFFELLDRTARRIINGMRES